jgi:hypothetical protein
MNDMIRTENLSKRFRSTSALNDVLSNATKMEGNKTESRYLCPGTPVTFTEYNLVGRTQYDFTIPDFRFPSYQPNTALSNGTMVFDITAQ